MVRRNEEGGLVAVPYHEAFAGQVGPAASKLIQAAALAEDPGLKRYLELRAVALITDDYRPSDMAWMSMKDNAIDVVIGPIETYEDQLFGYKAAFEAYVLVKDLAWSGRLSRYAAMLPALQRGLARAGGLQEGNAGHRLRPQRLRRGVLRGRLQRRRQDDRDQPAQRRAGAAGEGHAAAPAQERDAGQVRQDPRAHRRAS